MKTHIEMLTEMGVAYSDGVQYIDDLEKLLPKYGIAASKTRLAHFFSQILHESGSMHFVTENLNYSARALRLVFNRYFQTDSEAEEYARQPEKIANRVYARRMGNGAESSGDGWRYRGRGFIQLTGKNNYKAFAGWIGDDRVVTQPEIVATDYAVHSAVFFWDKNGLNAVADRDDVKQLTKRINGGDNGLAHRRELLGKANGLLAILDLQSTAMA
jgi:predicted chitinase